MKRHVLTPSAKRDVNDIWDYIANDNIEAADRVLDALESAMVKLAKNPGIGHWREELADKRHRFLLVYSYLIVIDTKRSRFRSFVCFMLRVMCKASWDCRRMNRSKTEVSWETPSLSLRLRNCNAFGRVSSTSHPGVCNCPLTAAQS